MKKTALVLALALMVSGCGHVRKEVTWFPTNQMIETPDGKQQAFVIAKYEF